MTPRQVEDMLTDANRGTLLPAHEAVALSRRQAMRSRIEEALMRWEATLPEVLPDAHFAALLDAMTALVMEQGS